MMPLMVLTGAENNNTVTTESGTAASCIKGMRLPRLLRLLSDKLAIRGSVTASKILLSAVISPRMVKNPRMTNPGLMNCVAPSSISA